MAAGCVTLAVMPVDIPLTVTPPQPPPSFGVIVVSFVMAAVSVFAGGVVGIIGLVFFGGGTVVLILARRRPEWFPGTRGRADGRLVLDGDGARVTRADGTVEAVRWGALTDVTVHTTSDGPFGEDLYWLLQGSDDTGCSIPGDAAVRSGLLDHLGRLDGLDSMAVIEAVGCTTEAFFPVWRGAPGEGAVVGDGLR